MKKLKIRYLFLLPALLFLGGCTESDETPAVTTDRGEIVLSGGGVGLTRADAPNGFPNEASIGIVASVYDPANKDEDDNVILLWDSYPDILNAQALATTVTNGVYSVKWGVDGNGKKYWPFDGGQLAFMAYSPHTDAYPLHISLDTDSLKRLNFQLSPISDNTPDVMWASNNGTHTAYNKDVITESNGTYHSPTVLLGEFQHALSRLTVEVQAEGNMNPNIVVTSLTVETTIRSAEIELTDGTVNLGEAVSTPYVYTLIDDDSGVAFKTQSIDFTVLLLPGTEDVTEVSVTLKDLQDQSDIRYTYAFMVPFFTNVDINTGKTLKLEQGKRTTTRIIVQSIGVPTPTPELDLKGVISDWEDRGKFGVTIN